MIRACATALLAWRVIPHNRGAMRLRIVVYGANEMHQRFLCVAFVVLTASVARADKIVYEPLSTEAQALGRLDKYEKIETKTVALKLDGLELEAHVPTRCDAYDAVPIRYTLRGTAEPFDRVAIEGTAFEDESKRNGRDLYDLAIPGSMKLEIEYLGSQTGNFDAKRVTRLTPDSRHTVFPPYALEPFVRSGVVRRGNYLFFKFRIRNAGDTILDPEGFGGWLSMPEAVTDDADGKGRFVATTANNFERTMRYLYPGESLEQWVHFWSPGQHPSLCRTLPRGTYTLRYRAAYRDNADYNWIVNMWGGRLWTGLDVTIDVNEQGGAAPVKTKAVDDEPPDRDRMTRYIRSLEEFMTSLRVYERDELAAPRSETIHVQVAPWTKHIVLKLIGNRPGRIATVAVPVAVSAEGLAIRANPDNPFVVRQGRRRVPAFCAQLMPAMRTTIQLGPHPEQHLRERLREATDAGLNLICTTSGDWHLPEAWVPGAFVGDVHAETFKYFCDVITRQARIPVLGWGVFPPKTDNAKGLGELMLGKRFDIPQTGYPAEYNYSHRPEYDVAHPDFPKVYAGAILFNYKHWGDQWYRTADGEMPIDVEDTWGWLRDDIHVRYYLGPYAIRRFHDWLTKRYGTIERVNAAWGSTYANIDDIDPQKDQPDGGEALGTSLRHCRPEYRDADNPFHDWSPAIMDWDVFRTELRCDVYGEIQRLVRERIPNAWINLRTEGAIIPVDVPADSNTAHLRHVYYSQRRNALVADVLARRKVFRYHSDYTTLPYSESEWRLLLRKLREEGIRGNYLPQFCTARDMVLNDTYGRSFETHYNLAAPKKAVMLHVLQAAYPVWRIQYEEGHLPGVLWEDYGCDGFVTETQMRELRLLRERLDALRTK